MTLPDFALQFHSPRAQALDARLEQPAAGEPERLAFQVRDAGASAAFWDALERHPEARGQRSSQSSWIELSRQALQSLASEHEEAQVLHSIAHGARSAPGPLVLVGVVNVTPDSFSDGGSYLRADRAIEHGLRLVEEGAVLLDVGGESTRPGAAPVGVEEELERVLPVIEGLASQTPAPICIDTSKPAVAAQAVERGAAVWNDIRAGLADEGSLALAAELGVGYVLMHMQGSPAHMQDDPRYSDCGAEVRGFLRERVRACLKAGIQPSKIAVDPGIGFGKRLEDNLQLFRSLHALRSFGLPVYVGPSRKTFIGELTGVQDPSQRILGTAGAVAACAQAGVDLVRVHDVAQMRECAAVACAIAGRELMSLGSDSQAPVQELWRSPAR